ncbi:MAG: RHS repeat-associated core domain-containing protein [Anaerolineae bacterium]|nr:RHS repeat-associated core domain-containing protein [Anaerolineae bacterium]
MVRATLADVLGVVIDYTYNGDGLMVAEDVNGDVTTFTWDQALELPQMLAASNGDRYLYGHDRLGVERNNVWSYPLPDALGTVRQRTDAAGNVTSNSLFDPFGRLVQHQGAYDRFGFTGEWSGATGRQYLRARWYNPESGRFTQVDPFAGVLEVPGTQHPYAYGLNNPLSYVDPSGRVVTEAVVLGLVAAAVVYTAGYLTYDALVPDVAQGFTGWHALGYILGYENIRQDIKTMRNSCAKWWQRGLAGLDAVWNAALGISMVHGLLNGLLHTFSLAKSLLKAGPASHSMLTLGNITLQESATVMNPFRVPGTTNILVPPGYLGGNKLKVLGALAHEIAHIQQEFGLLGGILKPLQGVSVATTKGAGLPLAIWGYALNPVEIHAAASGMTNWVNLALVTVIKPYIAGVQNGLINDYDFNAQVSIFFKKVFNVKF